MTSSDQTPPDDRTDPPARGSTLEVLRGFLDFHRRTLLLKAAGLAREDLSRTHPPSAVTLGGLLGHLAYVEDYWIDVVLLGGEPTEPFASAPWDQDDDWEWTLGRTEPDQARDLLQEIWARTDARLDAWAAEPGDVPPEHRLSRGSRGELGPLTLTWVLTHLIEEYCRHNGHADLLREAIDGSTGE